jgi:hypothetical protein
MLLHFFGFRRFASNPTKYNLLGRQEVLAAAITGSTYFRRHRCEQRDNLLGQTYSEQIWFFAVLRTYEHPTF